MGMRADAMHHHTAHTGHPFFPRRVLRERFDLGPVSALIVGGEQCGRGYPRIEPVRLREVPELHAPYLFQFVFGFLRELYRCLGFFPGGAEVLAELNAGSPPRAVDGDVEGWFRPGVEPHVVDVHTLEKRTLHVPVLTVGIRAE